MADDLDRDSKNTNDQDDFSNLDLGSEEGSPQPNSGDIIKPDDGTPTKDETESDTSDDQEKSDESEDDQSSTDTQSPDSSDETASESVNTDQDNDHLSNSEPEADETPLAAPVSVETEKPKSSGLKMIVSFFVVLLVLSGLTYLGYNAFVKSSDTPAKTAASSKKDIPLLRLAIYGTPLNAFYPANNLPSLSTLQVDAQIYEGLVQFTDKSKITPLLATSWTNPDDSTWIFNLKPNVKFHTGRVMTAADVKYSIETFQKDSLGAEFAFGLKSIDVINDNQVKITTDAPDPLLLHKLAYLYIVDSKASKPGDPSTATGPYEVKPGTTPSETSLELVAFDGYHGGHIYTKAINWTASDDEDELAKALIDGKLDFASGIDTQKNIDAIKKQTKMAIVSDKSVSISHIGINIYKKGSPLANLKFRQAIDTALDRTEIIKATGFKSSQATQIVPQDVPGYNPDIKATPHDLNKAKQLLADAGYANGATFTISYSKGGATDLVNNIATQLKPLGITVQLDPQDDFQALVDKVNAGQTDAFILSYGSDLLDASDPIAVNFQSINYKNPKIDDLLTKAGTTIDQAKRLQYLQDASKILMDDVAWVPLYSIDDTSVQDPSLVIKRDNFNGSYFWQVYRQ